MDYTYHLPGTTAPEITLRPGFLEASLFADGVKLRGRGTFIKSYMVPIPDGSAREITLSTGAGGYRIRADGVETPVGPQSSAVETIIAMLPIALVVTGGLLGGVIGGMAVGLNMSMARGRDSAVVRIATMLLTTVLAFMVWWATVQLLRSLI
jgi:hypothetical protein